MNKYLIAAAALSLGAVSSGAAHAANWSTTTTLAAWSSAAIVDGDNNMSFALTSYGALPGTTSVTLTEQEIGGVDYYDVGFGFGSAYAGGDTIVYSLNGLGPSPGLINAAKFDTTVGGSGLTSASKFVTPPGVSLLSTNGANSGYTSFAGQTSVTVSDKFDLSATGTFSDAHNTFQVTAVPEPETYAMLLAGLGVMSFCGRRRKAKRD